MPTPTRALPRPVRAAAAALLTASLLAACSGGGAATTGPGGATAPAASLGAIPTIALGSTAPGLPTPAATEAAPNATDAPASVIALPGTSFRASGTQVRVVNLYRTGPGDQTAVDIYGDSFPKGAPLLTVPYGTVSPWFDPGIHDDEGDAFITFYPAGKKGTDDQLMMQTETLKGTERITMIFGAGENMNAAGAPFGSLAPIFENGVDFPLPTAPAGQALLLVNAQMLNTLPPPAVDSLYAGLGKECLKPVDADQFTGPQPISPHTATAFGIPPGSQTMTFHTEMEGCTVKSPFPPATLNMTAGQRAYLVLYSPDDKELKTIFLPIEG